MAEGRWEPIFDRRLADEARAAVRAIGDDLATFPAEPTHVGAVALFWAYAAGIWDDDPTNARYAVATERLVERIGSEYDSHVLLGGLAGDGWVVSHVANDSDELLAMVDRELVGLLAPDAWPGSYDLIEGVVGLGVYFVERLANDPAAVVPREGLTHVVRHLDAIHEQGPDGATWHTPNDQMPPWNQPAFPAGCYNCGLAHGVPGVVGLLGAISARADAPARARPLLDDAMRWVWAQQLPPAPRGRFPAFVVGNRPAEPTRTAWCYGDLGVAIALWSAAQRTGQSVATAHALAREVAVRPFELCRSPDAGLCHGAAGMGHILNRFYQASGDPVFRDSAIGWYERALASRTPGEGIGGYLTPPMLPPGHTAPPIPSPGLLEGATGVGLALMAGFADSEPAWDRMLLCDLAIRETGS